MSEGLYGALHRLRAFLDDLGRPAAIIGGIAIIARVGTRATRDVDVVISASGGVDECLRLATKHGYAYDALDSALFAEGLIRLRLGEGVDGGMGVDLIVADVPYLERVIRRAGPVDLAGVELPVAIVEDLLIMKLEAGRPLDIEDVLSIKDAFEGTLDWGLVRQEATSLGVLDRLQLYFADKA